MNLLAVLVGGIVGSGLRLLIDTALPHADDAFPTSTLLVNLVGSLVLGLLVARLWPVAPEWMRAGLGAGLLGSFTTFSAVIASLFTLTRAGVGGVGLLYLAISLIGGLALAAVGLRLGRVHATTPEIGPDE
ncbi:N/A [soil metagenome]